MPAPAPAPATPGLIRRSRPADGARVMEIWRSAVDATHDFLAAADRLALDAMLRDFLPQAPLWLRVDAADHPLAFMLIAENHLEALFVDARHRGAGIGAQLVHHGLALHPALTVDVNEQNGQAIGFYRHLGFQPTGRSAHDGQGRPYPILHLAYAGANGGNRRQQTTTIRQ